MALDTTRVADAAAELTLTIDGDAGAAAGRFDVVNPATGAVLAGAPECDERELDRAFASAERAFAGWRTDDDARASALKAAAKAVLAASDEIVPILIAEQGKPRSEAVDEVRGVAGWLMYYSRLEVPRQVIQDDERALVEVLRKPVGVVAAITPWNFPLLLSAWKLGPALRAGNSVVLKPSPFTPLAALKLGEVLRDVLPDGVLNVVSGGDHLGPLMTGHPAVRKISFTGSIPTGKLVAAAAASDLKRVTLELGGNDAAIVLEDADPGAIAKGLFWGAFYNAGQVCCAIKRVYAPESLYAELTEALAAEADSVRVGDGADEGTQMGPIQNLPQYEKFSGMVAEAIDSGARVATRDGGADPGAEGYFFRPTILADLDERLPLVAEEQFGPALPVLPYRDLDDALGRANSTNYGLSGSVWSADPKRGAEVASRLECGTAWVNTHLANAPHQPFGGFKWSGIGVENGLWGLDEFSEMQVVHRARP
jgi:acyl-CoA reductase-like NAD-dependent aldehyde dehydrogenase